MPLATRTLSLFLILLPFFETKAQAPQDQMGAWYMYFFDRKPGTGTIGFQGDIQFRNWDLGEDLEQLLLRGGATYRPKGTDVKLTLGMGHITTGSFGESDETTSEFRVYQEALLPHRISDCLKLNHRFRYEQRSVQDQEFRTRYRYNLFLTYHIKKLETTKGAIFVSLYNELFINGQKRIGEEQQVARFDRNRTYVALGYGLSYKLKLQLGVMRQSFNTGFKDQVQLSVHQKF